MAEELHSAFGAETKLVPGRSGIFDVIVDDKLMFSKFQVGRFPESGEVVAKLR